MSSYRGKDLFGSGPHGFTVHGLELRHEVHERPGSDGASVSVSGRSGRVIEQAGTLVADSVAELQGQMDAIEGAMDGEAGELVDELGRSWAGVLMLRFEPGKVRRAGQRFVVDYAAAYQQFNVNG